MSPQTAILCSEEDVLGTAVLEEEETEPTATPEPDAQADPATSESDNLINLLSVTVKTQLPDDAPGVISFFKHEFTVSMGRAEPRDQRGYFITVDTAGEPDDAPQWREADAGEDDVQAVFSAMTHIAETLATQAEKQTLFLRMRALMSEVPVSALADATDLLRQVGLSNLIEKLHEATKGSFTDAE